MANAELTGVQKAAVLLITLGPEKSASIFKHLKEEEIEELTLEIANTRSISPQEKEDVLNEFYQVCLAQQYIAEGGIGYAKELLEKVKTKALSVFDKASSLSGGNQQKVIVAKVLNSDLKVVILDEPTKGVDVGAKAQIYEIMSELAAQGFGVIMISSEMPEVLGMADTILVMKEGRVSKIFADATGVTQEQILEAAMNM